jgi:hypothetical protein
MKKIVLILFLITSSQCYAQTALSAAGGEASGANGKVSFTTGQVLYTTQNGNGQTENQGVQQPYEVSTSSNINENQIPNLVVVFPNPTSGQLQLQIEKFTNNTFSYQLLNATGSIIQQYQIAQATSILNLQSFASGIYNLRIIQTNGATKNFKIVKK